MDDRLLLGLMIGAGVLVGIPVLIVLAVGYTKLYIWFLKVRTRRAQAEAALTLELAQAARAKADQMRLLVEAEGELHELDIERKRKALAAESKLRAELRKVKADPDLLQRLSNTESENEDLRAKLLIAEGGKMEKRR